MSTPDHDLQFCNWAAALDSTALSAPVLETTTTLVADLLGCVLGGVTSPVAAACRAVSPPHGDGSRVPGLPHRWSPPEAARHVAIAGHVLEMDDVVSAASLHPAVAVISAALAVGDHVDASGPDFLASIVAGYELMVRLGEAVDPAAHYADGFHPTATCGAFAAALTAAKLLGADAEELRHALGFAGTGVGGTLSYLNDGAPTKPIQVGNTTAYGVTAALVNHAGVPGPGTVFEGRHGFYQAYAPKADPGVLTKGLGSDPLRILDTSLKPYACCRYVQPALALALDLRVTHGLRPEDVAEVRVGSVTPAIPIVVEPRDRKVRPHSVPDAQFSLPFGVALALATGSALPRDVEAAVGDPAIEALAERVHVRVEDELDRAYPARWGATVEVVTTSGETHRAASADAKGDPANPLTRSELRAKVAALTDDASADQVLDAVTSLPDLTVRELIDRLPVRSDS